MKKTKAFTPLHPENSGLQIGEECQIKFLPTEKSRPLGRGVTGFSLVELLIASAIFAVVMVSIYSAFRTGIFGYKNIQENIDTYQAARFIFNRMDLDLRNAFIYSANNTGGFVGSKEGMSFYSIVERFYDGKAVQDYAFISYELKDGKLLRTCYRNRNKDMIINGPEIQAQELPGSIDSLVINYAYIDQTKNKNTLEWTKTNTWMAQDNPPTEEVKVLPVAVNIKLRLKNKAVEDFERTIFLPLGG
ncbi:MAG: prepilin-type N-terminal cleavage/methylation domain-containing protein [Candidatus Omnitrophica bacterium]|nr:prepilin-type N-terminal cleavage/methylation domain-containing protein [Candidatus Omnitrophota bacterium]